MKQTLRPRRMRISEGVRSLVRETSLSAKDFVYPIFVVPGEKVKAVSYTHLDVYKRQV